MACNNQSSLFGASDQYIKFPCDLIAIQGPNTVEKQILKDLRFKYAQLLRGRITLKAGQVDYLLNHLGLGDNATFLSIAATYDPRSKIEADNYIQYNFANDLSKNHYMSHMMILTGNSTNRVPQLYLTNPNPTYNVQLDVLVANIDDTYQFFTDVSQSGLSYTGLDLTDIHSYIVGESIVIKDKSSPPKPLVYIKITNINSIERSGMVLTIDDQSLGTLLLKFTSEEQAIQAFSLLNYVLENPNVDIDNLSPLPDNINPVVYFYDRVGGTGDYIALNGDTSGVPYNTSQGNTFSTSISLGGYFGVIEKSTLTNILIDYITDNRDGTMSITASNLIISGTSGAANAILNEGTYSVTFDFSDLAQNYLSGVVISLTINS